MERKIKHWIENERKIVTYRQVAREAGCSVSEAKNILLSYSESHPSSSLHITYLLTGPLLSTAALALTQLPTDLPTLTAKSLAKLSATQKIKIVDMDQVSDGERNSQDGLDDDDGLTEDGDGDEDVVGNDKGDEGGGGGGLGVGSKGDGADEVIRREEGVKRMGVVLVGMEGLDQKMELFEPGQVHVHIYSLEPSPIKDPSQYLIPALTLRNHTAYHDSSKYHTITGDAFVPESNISGGGKKAGPMKDGAMEFGKKKDVTAAPAKKLESSKSSVPVSSSKGEVKPAITKSETSSKKSATNPVSAVGDASSSKVAISSSKPSQKSSGISSKKKRVVMSDDEAEATEGEAETESSKKLAPESKGKAVEPTSSMVRADDQAAMEAMMDMDVDMDGDVSMDAGDLQPKRKSGERRKRKVKKTRMETDSKGYMDYYTDESYSGASDEDAKPDIKKTTSTKSAAPNPSRQNSSGSNNTIAGSNSGKAKPPIKPSAPAARGQSTLAGFFKKK